jgi:hypothetical protein
MSPQPNTEAIPIYERKLEEPSQSGFWGGGTSALPQLVLDKLRRWKTGDALTVCFFGVKPQLRGAIRDAAVDWTQYANVGLDFGSEPSFRTCRPIDNADIRITIRGGGYASRIGADRVAAGRPTMYLQDFDTSPPPAPRFHGVVRHEFGHALGFRHEHQNPKGGCDDQFDLDKLYVGLAKPPNSWDKPTVDDNLLRLSDSGAFEGTAYDPLSVMHYAFDPWMFKAGEKSRCFVPFRHELSQGDKEGARTVYPPDAARANRDLRRDLERLSHRFKAPERFAEALDRLR